MDSNTVHISHSTVIALSIFVVVCAIFIATLGLTWIRRQFNSLSYSKTERDASWRPHSRRLSYESFEGTVVPYVFLDAQFIQPPSSSAEYRSNLLSPIQEIRGSGNLTLTLPMVPPRRHSAPKSISVPVVSRPTLGCVSSCIALSSMENPTLQISISFVHTVELLRVVISRVRGISEDAMTVYALRLRVIPRSRTSAYLSRPLVTPGLLGSLEFDHLFEYAVSLQRLERAKLEFGVFSRPCKPDDGMGRRRHTVGPVDGSRRGGVLGIEVKMAELLTEYQLVGKAEVVLDTLRLKANPEAFKTINLALKAELEN